MNEITLSRVVPDVFRDMIQDGSGLWNSNVTFRRGMSYLVMADSGTGKSSLCGFLYGNRRDYSGDILFDGVDIRRFGIERWSLARTTSLAFLPQEMHLFPELSVYENICIKNRLTGYKSEKEIVRMLERLDVAEKLHQPVSKLSIGQQQRVALIRTLCQPMDFLLLDEPVSHLDAKNNDAVASLITEEATSQGAGIIATSVGYDIALDFNLSLSL